MPKKIPFRKCIGCGEMIAKSELIRVVKTPEEDFILDESGRANGRGAYICKKMQCLEKAIKSKGLERSFKVKVPANAYEALTEQLGKMEGQDGE